MESVKTKLSQKLAEHRTKLAGLIKDSGTKVVDQVTIEQILSGSRGIHSLL